VVEQEFGGLKAGRQLSLRGVLDDAWAGEANHRARLGQNQVAQAREAGHHARRGRMLGALTVQSREEAAFDEDTIGTLQTMVDQVAVALDNAVLFAQAQAALEAERSAYGELSRQQWQALLEAQPDLGYVSDADGTATAGDLWEPQMEVALETGETITVEQNVSAVSIPIRVRDQVIGVVDGRKPDGSRWTPEEIEVFQAMARMVFQYGAHFH